VTLAWTEVIHAVLKVVLALRKSSVYEHCHARAYHSPLAQREELAELVDKCKATVSRYESRQSSAEKQMETLQCALRDEIRKAGASFSQRHQEHAAARAFEICKSVREEHSQEISGNPRVGALHSSLTKWFKKIRVNSKKAHSAREVLAFCESLQQLFHSIGEQEKRHIEVCGLRFTVAINVFAN
jgi:uncharacterized protein YukE